MTRLLCAALEGRRHLSDGDQTTSQEDLLLLLLDLYDFDRNSLKNVHCRTRLISSDNDDDDADDDEGNLQLPRQVDPMHSCIEAKCSGSSSHNYMDCVFRNCISVYQLGLRRLLASKRGTTRRVFGQTTTTERIRRSSPDERDAGEATRLEAEDAEDKEDDDEEEEESHRKRSSSHEEETEPTGIVGNGVFETPRRGFNDIADVCVQHHCGSLHPHSMNFFSCVESHCAYR